VISGYSFNRTRYTKSTIYENGSLLRYNPAHTANLSFFYTFSQSFVKGLSMGFSTLYMGERFAGRNTRLTVTNDAYKTFPVPAYLQFDLSAAYSIDRVSLRLKMSNVLNELSYNVHDDNSVNPIAPRQLSATVSYKF
jgi:iron complex outermembrane receptor protein